MAQNAFSAQIKEQITVIFDHFKNKNTNKVSLDDLLNIVREVTTPPENTLLLLVVGGMNSRASPQVGLQEFISILDTTLGQSMD